jgi:hypothetical protein
MISNAVATDSNCILFSKVPHCNKKHSQRCIVRIVTEKHLDVERSADSEVNQRKRSRNPVITFYPNGHIEYWPLPILECHNYAIITQKKAENSLTHLQLQY